MDAEKGAVLSWEAQVFKRWGADDEWEEKAWLPDLPGLGRMLVVSYVFVWTEQCRQEVLALGEATKYTFQEYLAEQQGSGGQQGERVAEPVVGGKWAAGVVTGEAGVAGGHVGQGVQQAQAMALLDPVAPSVADLLKQLEAAGGGVLEERDDSGSEDLEETSESEASVVKSGEKTVAAGDGQVTSSVASCSIEYTTEELELMMQTPSRSG
ncbi:hypothetical protein M758_UG164300 [Ceratodon purpureus]|nr:hypothetical protein M758_UG164300 [Ceratodon purpureus]